MSSITALSRKIAENGIAPIEVFRVVSMTLSQFSSTDLLPQLRGGNLLRLAPDREGCLILCKPYQADLLGPGAAVGGVLDFDCFEAIAIGDVAVVHPQDYHERSQSLTTRHLWQSYKQKLLDCQRFPMQRAIGILNLLRQYFETDDIVQQIPDRALALLVGVLPQTIAAARLQK